MAGERLVFREFRLGKGDGVLELISLFIFPDRLIFCPLLPINPSSLKVSDLSQVEGLSEAFIGGTVGIMGTMIALEIKSKQVSKSFSESMRHMKYTWHVTTYSTLINRTGW
jgi:hypothetical protein